MGQLKSSHNARIERDGHRVTTVSGSSHLAAYLLVDGLKKVMVVEAARSHGFVTKLTGG